MALGGKREGSGRKLGYRKPEGVRKARNMRAYDDEWELIKQFSVIVKKDKIAAEALLKKTQ